MHRLALAAALTTGGLAACNRAAAPGMPPSRADTSVPVQEGILRGAGGVRLFYRAVGHGADTIVVLHGGPGQHSMQMHRDLLPLSSRRVVIYYDQRGGGRSELPTDTTALTMAHHVADLEALRQHFRLDRLTLLGHSFGPALAASYALAHPTRVARMVFVGPVPPRRGTFFREYGANMARRMDSAALGRMNRLGSELATSADPVATCREFWRLAMPPRMAEPARASELREDPCDAPPEALRYASRHAAAGAFRSLGAWDWREGLRQVAAPTLILHGEHELIPMRLVEEWTQALPHARLVRVPGAGHFPFVERPDVFYPAVDAFLTGR